MATMCSLTILLICFIFMGGYGRVSAEGGDMEEVDRRLFILEDGLSGLRSSLLRAGNMQDHDMQNVMVMAIETKKMVAEQENMLQSLQEGLEDYRKNQGQQPNKSSNANGMIGPCLPGNHTVLNDNWRAITGEYDGDDDKCDKDDLENGWYRFLLDNCSAVIPTTCVPEHHCQTDAPTWVNLGGGSMPNVGEEVQASACSHWGGDCCNWSSDITVRNCGQYYVYKIEKLRACDLAFCVKDQYE